MVIQRQGLNRSFTRTINVDPGTFRLADGPDGPRITKLEEPPVDPWPRGKEVCGVKYVAGSLTVFWRFVRTQGVGGIPIRHKNKIIARLAAKSAAEDFIDAMGGAASSDLQSIIIDPGVPEENVLAKFQSDMQVTHLKLYVLDVPVGPGRERYARGQTGALYDEGPAFIVKPGGFVRLLAVGDVVKSVGDVDVQTAADAVAAFDARAPSA